MGDNTGISVASTKAEIQKLKAILSALPRQVPIGKPSGILQMQFQNRAINAGNPYESLKRAFKTCLAHNQGYNPVENVTTGVYGMGAVVSAFEWYADAPGIGPSLPLVAKMVKDTINVVESMISHYAQKVRTKEKRPKTSPETQKNHHQDPATLLQYSSKRLARDTDLGL